MGFIDYNGTKEDRYDEILDYAHTQQEEDWKRKQSIKIKKWLIDLTGNGDLANFYIQDLLKLVMVRYKELWSYGKELINKAEVPDGLQADQIWNDFTMEYVMRHIEPFHMIPEMKEKHFDTFLIKIFKICEEDKAENFYISLSENPAYRRYLTECFDPAWKGQEFFKLLQSIAKKDKAKKAIIEKLINVYKQLGVSVSLYLYQAVQPRDDGWIIQESAEWNALCAIEDKIRRNKLPTPDYRLLHNPIIEICDGRAEQNSVIKDAEASQKSTIEEPDNIRRFDDLASNIPHSKLKKKEFTEYIKRGGIPNFVNACLLLLDCDLPDDIRETYDQLIIRMPILQDAIDKFDSVYHADMYPFNEYYAPEALQITATYLDYLAVAPSDSVLQETRDGVTLAIKKLIQVVNEKIDEIYKFVTIETNAEAKALEAVMIQDGYVDANYKINL